MDTPLLLYRRRLKENPVFMRADRRVRTDPPKGRPCHFANHSLSGTSKRIQRILEWFRPIMASEKPPNAMTCHEERARQLHPHGRRANKLAQFSSRVGAKY